MLIIYAAVSVLPAPAAGTAGPYAVLAGSACSFPLFRLPCALHLFGVPWSRTSHILWQGLVFDSCGVRLWLGAPDHIPARERSRLRCPNVDRIRRRFRSSSLGCRCSGTIRGVGGQRVFLPSVPSALRPLFAWCSVEQNQPHPMAGPCSDPCGARLWLERPAIYLQGKDPVYGAQMLIVYAVVSVLPTPAVGAAGPYAVLAGSACSFPLFRLPCALHLGVPYKPAP